MLETRDLILKTGEFEDWKDMYNNLWKHKESAKYMLWTPLDSEEAAKQRMVKNIDYQQRNQYQYFVYEKKSHQAIGFAGMEEVAPNIYEDTGIAIGPAFVGQGYGKQIVNGLMKCAFEQLGAVKFIYSCRQQNIESKRLQQSLGFTYSHSVEKVDTRTNESYVLEYYELKEKNYRTFTESEKGEHK